jgi:hypothetical protein
MSDFNDVETNVHVEQKNVNVVEQPVAEVVDPPVAEVVVPPVAEVVVQPVAEVVEQPVPKVVEQKADKTNNGRGFPLCDGVAPFDVAIKVCYELLVRNVEQTLKYMEHNNRDYANVRLRLGLKNKLKINCTYADGTTCVRYYSVADAFYGPTPTIVRFDVNNPRPFWDNFKQRKKVWHTKWQKTGLSPFKTLQCELSKRDPPVYLYDNSRIDYKQNEYVTKIILSKTAPVAPFKRVPAGYGYPYSEYKPEHPKMKSVNTNQRYVKKH